MTRGRSPHCPQPPRRSWGRARRAAARSRTFPPSRWPRAGGTVRLQPLQGPCPRGGWSSPSSPPWIARACPEDWQKPLRRLHPLRIRRLQRPQNHPPSGFSTAVAGVAVRLFESEEVLAPCPAFFAPASRRLPSSWWRWGSGLQRDHRRHRAGAAAGTSTEEGGQARRAADDRASPYRIGEPLVTTRRSTRTMTRRASPLATVGASPLRRARNRRALRPVRGDGGRTPPFRCPPTWRVTGCRAPASPLSSPERLLPGFRPDGSSTCPKGPAKKLNGFRNNGTTRVRVE